VLCFAWEFRPHLREAHITNKATSIYWPIAELGPNLMIALLITVVAAAELAIAAALPWRAILVGTWTTVVMPVAT